MENKDYLNKYSIEIQDMYFNGYFDDDKRSWIWNVDLKEASKEVAEWGILLDLAVQEGSDPRDVHDLKVIKYCWSKIAEAKELV